VSSASRAAPADRQYIDHDLGDEIELPRGDVTEGVVRVGDTVRRPPQPQSLAVAGYLDHLECAGFGASPRFLGRDRRGRDVLTFLHGDLAGDPPERWAADDGLLAGVGRLVRRLHEASEGYGRDRGFAAPVGSVWGRDLVSVDVPVPNPVPDLITHNDVTPQNVVVRDGSAVGLIDFDLAGPAPRLLDAYNTAMHWVPLRPEQDLWPTWSGIDPAARLRIFADAYGMTDADRAGLIELGISRCEVTWLRMRAAAAQLGGGWARMWADGVGDVIRRRKAWLVASRSVLEAALLDGGE
jgi:hypothetical protein